MEASHTQAEEISAGVSTFERGMALMQREDYDNALPLLTSAAKTLSSLSPLPASAALVLHHAQANAGNASLALGQVPASVALLDEASRGYLVLMAGWNDDENGGEVTQGDILNHTMDAMNSSFLALSWMGNWGTAAQVSRAMGELLREAGAVGPAQGAFDRAAKLDAFGEPGPPPNQIKLTVYGPKFPRGKEFELDQGIEVLVQAQAEGETRMQISFSYERAKPSLPGAAPHMHAGLLALRDGENDQALSAFARAAELDPAFPDAPYKSGLVHLMRDEYERAAECFENTLELAPGWHSAEAYLWLAQQSRDGVFEPGLFPVLQELDGLEGAATASGSEEDMSAWQSAVDAAVAKWPAHPGVWTHAGSLAAAGKDMESAMGHFETALSCVPDGQDCVLSDVLVAKAAVLEDADKEEWRRTLESIVCLGSGAMLNVAMAKIGLASAPPDPTGE